MYQTPPLSSGFTKVDPYANWPSAASVNAFQPTNFPPTASWPGFNVPNWGNWNNSWNSTPSTGWWNRTNPTANWGQFGANRWPLGTNNFYSTELSFFPTRPGNFTECATTQNPICYDNAGNRWCRLCFDLRGFRPDECCVNVDAKNRCVCIDASHDCNESTFAIKREYHRKYFFPEDFKFDFTKCDFKCWLSSEGVLCVECPLPGLTFDEARFWSPTSATFPNQTGPFPNFPSFTANAYPVSFKTTGGGEPAGRATQTQQPSTGTPAPPRQQPTAPTQERR